MRLTPAELQEITGLTQVAAQARWFKDHFGVVVACDRAGPIMTKTAWEALVAKRYGLKSSDTTTGGDTRPTVKMKDAA